MTRESKLLLGAVIGIILAFLIGFGWQYTRARGLDTELNTATRELTFEKLESTLGAATVESYRGNYEIARQLASDFFTGLQRDIARAPNNTVTELQRILAQRDGIITSASRSDPQTASLLSQLFTAYRVAFGEAPPVTPPASTAPPSTTATTTTTQ